MIKFLFFFLFHFIVNKLFLKINFLIDKKEISEHKKKIITDSKTPLSGGFIFIVFFSFISIEHHYSFLIAIILLYAVGLMSDLNLLTSPIKRIILQSCLILSFIIINDLSIKTLSLEILDELLNYKFFNIFFLLVCLLVLVNGFNFLDGINTLVITNFIICLFSIYYISNKFQLYLDFILVQNLLIILSVIFIFNFFGKSFLGDSGTYSISFVIGIVSINFAYNNYLIMSPYFIACLLWYPAIENLFSILRRFFFKKKLSKADNNHLHHFLYLAIKKNNFIKNNLFLNTFTGIIINSYIFLSAFTATFYYTYTQTLLTIILFNVFIYFGLYYYLYGVLGLKKKNLGL